MIGEAVDIEASVSTLKKDKQVRELNPSMGGGCVYEMGSYPLLPIFKLMGTQYDNLNFYSRMEDGIDIYTRGVMHFSNAVCSFKLGMGVKTEGNLVISGTKGYVYVPSPWWKMDYYELRYDDLYENKKYFYKLDGEWLRYEIHEFFSCIFNKRYSSVRLRKNECVAMAGVMEQFKEKKNFFNI